MPVRVSILDAEPDSPDVTSEGLRLRPGERTLLDTESGVLELIYRALEPAPVGAPLRA